MPQDYAFIATGNPKHFRFDDYLRDSLIYRNSRVYWQFDPARSRPKVGEGVYMYRAGSDGIVARGVFFDLLPMDAKLANPLDRKKRSYYVGLHHNDPIKRCKDGTPYRFAGIELENDLRLSIRDGLLSFQTIKKKYNEHLFEMNPARARKKAANPWFMDVGISDLSSLYVQHFIREAWQEMPAHPTIIFTEGERRHRTREESTRNADVVKLAKQRYRESNGCLRCELCRFDFEKRYGQDIARGYIEAHHIYPLSNKRHAHEVTVDQFRLLCANCHRAVHAFMRRNMNADWEAVREVLKAKISEW